MAKTVDPYDAFRSWILAVVGKEGPGDEEDVPASVVQSITLFYTDPAANSDKVYKVWINRKTAVEYDVMFAYGRRGGTLKEKVKYSGSLASAKQEYQSVVDEKKGKGYTENIDGGFR